MELLCMRHKRNGLALCLVFGLCLMSAVGFSDEVRSTPKFAKQTMILGGHHLTVEMAMTPEEQEHGLMFRHKMADNAGMLFVFPNEQILNFWMKNTYIPLAIGFFNKDRKLIDIQEMTATSEIETHPPTYQSNGPAMYALELNKGWFIRHKVQVGAVFTLKKNAMGTKPVMRQHN